MATSDLHTSFIFRIWSDYFLILFLYLWFIFLCFLFYFNSVDNTPTVFFAEASWLKQTQTNANCEFHLIFSYRMFFGFMCSYLKCMHMQQREGWLVWCMPQPPSSCTCVLLFACWCIEGTFLWSYRKKAVIVHSDLYWLCCGGWSLRGILHVCACVCVCVCVCVSVCVCVCVHVC